MYTGKVSAPYCLMLPNATNLPSSGPFFPSSVQQSSPLVFSYKWHRSRERRLGSGRRRRPPDAKTLGNKIRRVSGSVPVLIDARVCVCAGAGMGRVQRLQGHDAGLLRRGGPQVLPLPVPQHLPGGTPRPPVATTTSLLLELDAASQGTPYPPAATLLLPVAPALLHTAPFQSMMNCIISCHAGMYVHCYWRSEDLSDSGRIICTTTKHVLHYCNTRSGYETIF